MRTHFQAVLFIAMFALPSSFHDFARAQNIIGDPRQLEEVTGSFNPFRYREGYVLGVISRIASEDILFTTLEGEVKLGVRSTRGGVFDIQCYNRLQKQVQSDHKSSGQPTSSETEEKIDEGPPAAEISSPDDIREDLLDSVTREKCTQYINPWHFSHQNEGLAGQIKKVQDSVVLIFYRSFTIMPFTETENILQRIYPTDGDLPLDQKRFEIPVDMPERLVPAYGSYVGRVVMASYDGIIRKAYEVVIQLGSSGDVFRKLSVSDRQLFNFIVQTMARNRMVRVHFFRHFAPVGTAINVVEGYDTYFRVFRVEVLDKDAEVAQ